MGVRGLACQRHQGLDHPDGERRAPDAVLFLRCIRELAIYEKAPDAVVASEADLLRHGFGVKRRFEAVLAFVDDKPAGFTL
jgi:hypothetical protein